MAKDTIPSEAASPVGITTEEILSELDAYFDPGEQMQPGDVTVKMFMTRYGIGDTQARRRMEMIAAGGAFTMLKVRGPNGGMWVLRKVV